MSDCFDHMCEALDGRWDDRYAGEYGGYAPRQLRCKYCKEAISFHGNIPWDGKKNQRHECDFSKLLEAS
jgi:hypothetical protein